MERDLKILSLFEEILQYDHLDTTPNSETVNVMEDDAELDEVRDNLIINIKDYIDRANDIIYEISSREASIEE